MPVTLEDNPIRQLRDLYGMNRTEFCQALGISYPYVSNMEAGRQPATAKALEKASGLGVDVRDLVEKNNAWLEELRAASAAALVGRVPGGGKDV
jgi:transcriptional regulator with XRE-family HTH domain